MLITLMNITRKKIKTGYSLQDDVVWNWSNNIFKHGCIQKPLVKVWLKNEIKVVCPFTIETYVADFVWCNAYCDQSAKVKFISLWEHVLLIVVICFWQYKMW